MAESVKTAYLISIRGPERSTDCWQVCDVAEEETHNSVNIDIFHHYKIFVRWRMFQQITQTVFRRYIQTKK